MLALHVDHGMREGAAAEAEAARRFAESLGLDFRLRRLAGPRGETAARAARYRAFREVAREEGASLLLLAHHEEDQFETLLFRLLRGTGPMGLACMPRLRPLFGGAVSGGGAEEPAAPPPILLGEPPTLCLRPWLDQPKARLLAALHAMDLPWIRDPTNADPSLTPRNRIRRELLPALLARPNGREGLRALLREARALRDECRARAALLRRTHVSPSRGASPLCFRLDAETRSAPAWVLETLLTALLRDLAGTAGLSWPLPPRRHLARLVDLCREGARPGAAVEARGRWRVLRRGDSLEFFPWSAVPRNRGAT